MQDEFGRPLSDDGQWVWDGSAWRPTGAEGGSAGPGTGGQDPTRVAPQAYQPTGGQPAQDDYFASQSPTSAYGAPGGPQGPGGPQEPVPFYKRPSVIIGALLVLTAVLVTILVLTSGNGKNNNAAVISPSVTPTTAAPTTAAPTTPPPTTPPPTTPPPTTPPPTTPPPTPPPSTPPPSNTVTSGIYDCTSNGMVFGSVNFQGNAYTTDDHSSGTYVLNPSTGAMAFTGGDLGDFTGTYNPSGPSMDLSSTSGTTVHCAQ